MLSLTRSYRKETRADGLIGVVGGGRLTEVRDC